MKPTPLTIKEKQMLSSVFHCYWNPEQHPNISKEKKEYFDLHNRQVLNVIKFYEEFVIAAREWALQEVKKDYGSGKLRLDEHICEIIKKAFDVETRDSPSVHHTKEGEKR